MIADSQVQNWHRTLLVGSVGLVSLAAWLMLWRFGAVLHGPVHHHHADGGPAVALLFVGSWTVMTIAMMLPTSVPLIATFQTIAGERPDRSLLIALVVIGYLAIWAMVGVVFYAGGALFQRFAADSTWLQGRTSAGSSLLLIVAGLYQFTPLKYRCLDKCRSPLSFVLGHWQGEHERRNAFRLGVHHGLFCVGCCWALMLLMFAVGIGNVVWMLLLGAVMAVEKNVSWGRKIGAPLGVLLTIGGLAMLARV
jgi:predicted metal-binding membrane protein